MVLHYGLWIEKKISKKSMGCIDVLARCQTNVGDHLQSKADHERSIKKICDQFQTWRADDEMSASIWRGNDRCDQHGSNILHFKHFPPSEIFFYSFSYQSIWGDVSICAYSMRITRTKIEHIFNCVFCWVSISPIGRHKSENSNRKSVFIFFSFHLLEFVCSMDVCENVWNGLS